MQIATDKGHAAEAELFCRGLRLVLREIHAVLSQLCEELSLVYLHMYYKYGRCCSCGVRYLYQNIQKHF